MAIEIKGRTISTVVTSSIMGHSGGGMCPLTLLPSYKRLREIIWENNIASLTKSSTAFKLIGNFNLRDPRTWKYIQRIGSDGMLNAYGLTNDGVKVNALGIFRACENGYNVIPNFFPQFSKNFEIALTETIDSISIYRSFMGHYFWAIELNFSCPNAKEKIQENINNALACVRTVRIAFPHLCIIAKISYVHPLKFAQELIKVGVDIIHAINTIPFELIYPAPSRSPLASVGGGGVSGGPAKKMAYDYNRRLRQEIDAPIIMGCGIMSLDDAARYIDIGASSISLCSVIRLNPKEAGKIIHKYS